MLADRRTPTQPTRSSQYSAALSGDGAAIYTCNKGKGSQYSITERRVQELIPVLGSQPAGGVSHKPSGRLPLLSARPAVTPATLKRAATNLLLGEQGHNGCEQFAQDCYPTASRLQFEPELLRLSPAR